ncbi:MAG: hypothetical protein ACQET8_22775 [Bacillota bacterium]
MAYKVIKRFRDKEDNNTIYEVGDEFPKGDSKATKKRLEELSSSHPVYRSAFIEEVAEKKKSKKDKE